MPSVFYALLAVMFTGYVVLDGFDLGAGALHLALARTDRERRTVLACIGPYWDGNEVWLLAAGGTMFLAFPRALGAALSGFYLPIFFVVWSLMLRGLAIELRNHLRDELWRAFWDFVFMASSALLPVLLGAALGNVLRGVPLDEQGQFTLPLFASLAPRAPVGVLDAYTVAVGVFALVTIVGHGAAFVAWKSNGEVHARASVWAFRSGALTALAWPVVLLASLKVAPHLTMTPLAWVFAAAAAASLALRLVWLRAGRSREAFFASAAFVKCALLGTAAARAPVLLASLDGARDLDAASAATSRESFQVALAWWPLALALAVGYTLNLLRLHKGKVVVADE